MLDSHQSEPNPYRPTEVDEEPPTTTGRGPLYVAAGFLSIVSGTRAIFAIAAWWATPTPGKTLNVRLAFGRFAQPWYALFGLIAALLYWLAMLVSRDPKHRSKATVLFIVASVLLAFSLLVI